MNSTFGIPLKTLESIHSVFKNHPEIESVIIYGSRAKGTQRIGSDIDLTLKGRDLDTSLLYQILQEIDELNTPYLFDISILEKLNAPDLEEHINRVGKIFYHS